MERGIKLGGVVGVISVIIGFIQPVITEGSIQYLTFIISNPTIILTSLVWNVAIFALLGAIYERQGGLSGNSQSGATQPSEFESSMSEFEE